MENRGLIKKFFSRFNGSSKKSGSHPNDIENEELKMKVELLERQLAEKTISVENAKSIFLKNIYHEIRTPLNVIVGFSNLLELNDSCIKDRRNYFSYIRESSSDFLRKMDDIIQASIIEAGIVRIDLDECKLYDLLGEIHSYFSFHKHVIDKDVAFLLSIPDELKEVMVMCDPYRIKQVISNLLLNAFKFTRKGVVELGFRLVHEEIEFFIKDTGPGGLEGKEDVVFNSFSKIDESDTSPAGLGLGLNIASKLTKIMNGRLWYDSEFLKGTTFYFTIPYRPVHIKKETSDQHLVNNQSRSTAKVTSDKTVVY